MYNREQISSELAEEIYDKYILPFESIIDVSGFLGIQNDILSELENDIDWKLNDSNPKN